MQPRLRLSRRLGLQVLFDFSDILDAIGFAAAHGFGVLELNLGNIDFGRQLARAVQRRAIRAASRWYKVKLAFHAVEGPSFFIPSTRVRQCAIAELKQVLDWAADTGARDVVMHLGFDMHYGMAGANRYTHEQFPEYFELVLLEALAELKQHARGRARLCVENVGGFRYPPARPALESLLGGSLGLCYDVGHVSILPPEKRQAEMDFFARHASVIYHAHIHDNHGLRDEHLPPGDGTIDFVPFFRLLSQSDAFVVFEVRPKELALKSLEFYRSRIEPELESLCGRSRSRKGATGENRVRKSANRRKGGKAEPA
uniref:Sugar phosphate isomerase/epimerase n=1 Tax=candidate division WOR-3 bacterium TaxID=2052148 RepID=A0A7C4CAT7_UNCW3